MSNHPNRGRPKISEEEAAVTRAGHRERAIPLTKPGPLWSRREYAEAIRLGIGFAAHRFGQTREVFHYGFPEGMKCTSIIVDPIVGAVWYIDHDFDRTIDWLERCRQAIAKREEAL